MPNNNKTYKKGLVPGTRLTYLRYSHTGKWGQSYSLYRCKCGVEKLIRNTHVTHGKTKSCGCKNAEHRKKIGEIRSPFVKGNTEWKKRKDLVPKNRGCYAVRYPNGDFYYVDPNTGERVAGEKWIKQQEKEGNGLQREGNGAL